MQLLKDCRVAARVLDGERIDDRPLLASGLGCIAYLSGWREGASISIDIMRGMARDKKLPQPEAPWCIPPGVTNYQLVLVVQKYLESHPEDLHREWPVLMIQVFTDSFQCPAGGNALGK